jgi:mRNA-degrading endonuclease YafQ of YafQ-DinJ toxin-antitoxin module
MKIKNIYYSTQFQKSLHHLSETDRGQIDRREKMFRNNCFDARLRTHKLKGRLKNYWAFSISNKKRVIFEFLEQGEVLFHFVGDHSIYG